MERVQEEVTRVQEAFEVEEGGTTKRAKLARIRSQDEVARAFAFPFVRFAIFVVHLVLQGGSLADRSSPEVTSQFLP